MFIVELCLYLFVFQLISSEVSVFWYEQLILRSLLHDVFYCLNYILNFIVLLVFVDNDEPTEEIEENK